jgi:hypothetical protein
MKLELIQNAGSAGRGRPNAALSLASNSGSAGRGK